MKLATDEQNYLQELPVCFHSSKAPESWICLSKVFEMPLQRANISKWTLQLQSSSFFQEHWEVSTDLIAVQEQSFGFSNADFLPVQEKALSYMSRIILFQAFPLEKKKRFLGISEFQGRKLNAFQRNPLLGLPLTSVRKMSTASDNPGLKFQLFFLEILRIILHCVDVIYHSSSYKIITSPIIYCTYSCTWLYVVLYLIFISQ